MSRTQGRIGGLFAVFALLLLLGAAKSLYLSGLQGGKLRRAARSQQVAVVSIPAQRGTIFDRGGRALAVSEPGNDVSATPYLVRDPVAAARALAPLLGTSPDALAAKLAARHSGFAWLGRRLPDAIGRQVAALRIPGIAVEPTDLRAYPDGPLAAQVLGTVGIDGHGLAGLEFSHDRELAGTAGQRRLVRDALGRSLAIDERHVARPGEPVRLTLDAAIQGRVENVLANLGATYRPKGATAIVMDPRTNAVLAMANWPRIDANNIGGAPPYARTNRAIGFDYEPGSTFKVVAIAGALSEGLVTPATLFDLPPQIQVADRTIHDAESRPAETLSVAQILSHSSNVGAIKIGLLLGRQRFDRWVRAFGFGSRTGIDLPGEERGLVLALDRYSGSSMGNLPIGQGEAVTALQIATAYSAIANGGIIRAPHVVAARNGRARPLPAGRRVISPPVAAQLRKMLEGVLAPGGTASEVSIPGYKLAGKTGTANKIDPATGQYSSSRYVASFVGFAPAANPQLLVAVVVDEPQGAIYGGTVAAPAFGQIMSFALPYMRVAPHALAAAAAGAGRRPTSPPARGG